MAKKYIDAEKLKAEIEKHIKEVKDAGKRFTPNMGFFDAKLSGIYDVKSIIDSLQQEQQEEPDKSLEEEINRYLEPIHTADIQFEPFTQMTKCARHFAEWGAEHAKKDETPVHADLEEAAKGYPTCIRFVSPQWTGEVEQAFIAGAKWQKEQMMKGAVEFECIGKKVTMTIQELINYYIDTECCEVAEECGF